MKYIVAVSGGVDSVVLLDMLAQRQEDELIVAHFDHGIRDDSADDATFVASLATKYGLPFETRREELGSGASEELARERRYAFLREVAKKHDAMIVTAHHADDVVETIAINLTRGTGWRGLAVLDSDDIERPLLDRTKAELIDYAEQNNLEWHEDSTNDDTKYLRNKLRRRLANLDDDARSLILAYWRRQVFLKRDSDIESGKFMSQSPYSRYMIIMMPESAAIETLRTILLRETGTSPTRPQLERALYAIKVLPIGKTHDVGNGVKIRFDRTEFVVEQ